MPEPHARTVAERYRALAASGAIAPDPAQEEVVAKLDGLAGTLNTRRLANKTSALGWLLGRKAEPVPRGLYLWGGVGRGKTMLMDLFFDSLTVRARRRTHFHAYMAEVHERIHAWRQQLKAGTVEGDDPIRPVAAALAAEAAILCFDEFAVTDIADAMILGRLFTALFGLGTVVVATSNVPPSGLYRDGLNRALFLPFISLLEERAEVHELRSRTDFRMEKIGDTPAYFTPADAAASSALDGLFGRMAGEAPARPATLTVHGHPVEVPRQAPGIARFEFSDLCSRPLGASDYIAIARAYGTVLIDRIPVLGPDQRNEARRFITLVDVLYERHVKLFASAAGEPEGLFGAETGAEAFEFARTVSRLHEMRSRDYLAAASGHATAPTGNSTGLVET